jgi:hypothetical protein
MRENRGHPDEPGILVDFGRVHGGDLVQAKRLAHDLEAARERSSSGGKSERRVAVSDFSGLVRFGGVTPKERDWTERATLPICR